ncbi:MAG: MmgE/PrpD family protein [Pseudomonadota bacterium]
MRDPIQFARTFGLSDAPDSARDWAPLCLMDLVGVAAGGAQTRLSQIIRDHAAAVMPGAQPMVFDGRRVSPLGQALALGMTIDALDGHDGFNPAKGHIGCGLLAGLVALWPEVAEPNPDAFLEAFILGYELGGRLALTLHQSVSDYHTSGAWIAVAVALVGARLLGLDDDATAHAAGIAEYHGPRSQMMRCIDHPTMVKDGSGWGAMTGVSAVLLARSGFTGAPALTLSGPPWHDLGTRWIITEQYFKPYPVCRWAQSPVEAALDLRRAHNLVSTDVARVEIESFHEATRLAVNDPKTTEEAQYSTSFPTAVALVKGDVSAADIADGALDDPEVRRLSEAMTMGEDAEANDAFPRRRLGKVRLFLTDGRILESPHVIPKWDPEMPATAAELRGKFEALVTDAGGPGRLAELDRALGRLPSEGPKPLIAALGQPL